MGKPVVIEEFGKALGKIQAWLCLPNIVTSKDLHGTALHFTTCGNFDIL